MEQSRRTTFTAGGEVALAVLVVAWDLFLPSLVLAAMAAVSLGVRRLGPASLGIRRPTNLPRLVRAMLLFSVAWAAFHVALLDPLVSHATGQHQDTSDFASLEGDVGKLVVLVALSWTLAAVVEEVAFRGYVFSRTAEVFGGGSRAMTVAVIVSALLFGLIHTEQGLVGIILAAVDGVAFGVLVLIHRTLWAAVLAHGFANTIGLTAFFLYGPIGPLW